MSDSEKRQEKVKNLKKWKQIPALKTEEEYKDFIKQSLEKRDGINRKVKIGEITKEAKERMNNVYGSSVSNIGIDNDGVIHSHKKAEHNLEPDDLLNAVDVINTSPDISLSDRKHRDCDVLEFDKDIDGDIKFLTEFHGPQDFLMVFNAMRKRKARKGPDATEKSLGANVQNVPPSAFISSIRPSFPDVNRTHCLIKNVTKERSCLK